MSLSLNDACPAIGVFEQAKRTYILTNGCQKVVYRFAKSFAPYQCRIRADCGEGSLAIQSWKIVPDVAAVVNGLMQWTGGGGRPSWLRGLSSGPAASPKYTFDHAVGVESFVMPQVVDPGQKITIFCKTRMLAFSMHDFSQCYFFVHLLNRDGEQVYAGGFSLAEAVAASGAGLHVVCDEPTGLAPGDYAVEIGIWNPRTGLRLSPSASSLDRGSRRNTVRAGAVRVE